MPRAAKRYNAKGKNRRIQITLFVQENKKEEPFFQVITKRLIDFKKRQITHTNNVFTVESMMMLEMLLSEFMNESVVKKEINPYTKIEKWSLNAIEYQLPPDQTKLEL